MPRPPVEYIKETQDEDARLSRLNSELVPNLDNGVPKANGAETSVPPSGAVTRVGHEAVHAIQICIRHTKRYAWAAAATSQIWGVKSGSYVAFSLLYLSTFQSGRVILLPTAHSFTLFLRFDPPLFSSPFFIFLKDSASFDGDWLRDHFCARASLANICFYLVFIFML